MKTKTALIALVLGLSSTLFVFLLVEANSALVRAEPSMRVLPVRAAASLSSLDPTSPTVPVRLIFIHHSTGENWLADDDGGLGIALRDNNYFVSDTYYGWGPPDQDEGSGTIGDHTDIGHWYNWFNGPNSSTYLAALYAESDQHSSYSRLPDDLNPGGENEIIMFKSCFPNSHLGGSPTDSPTTGDNPLRGQDSSSEYHTVGNAKGIYKDLLTYFATRQDKLFIVIAAPPLMEGETNATEAANARAFNNWLVNDWLRAIPTIMSPSLTFTTSSHRTAATRIRMTWGRSPATITGSAMAPSNTPSVWQITIPPIPLATAILPRPAT